MSCFVGGGGVRIVGVDMGRGWQIEVAANVTCVVNYEVRENTHLTRCIQVDNGINIYKGGTYLRWTFDVTNSQLNKKLRIDILKRDFIMQKCLVTRYKYIIG